MTWRLGDEDRMPDRTMPEVDRKARLKIPSRPLPKQAPETRTANWNEVYLPINLELAKAEAERPDESGRRRPLPTGDEFTVDADTVVLAIGYSVDQGLPEASGVEIKDWRIDVDAATGETSRPGVFAGGDCVDVADLVVTALADGRRAAIAIDKYLVSLAKEAA